MKKIAFFMVIVSSFLLFTACSSNKATIISDGTYTLNVEENEASAPSVTISDGTFTFTFDLLSSYSNNGSFLLKDDILTLTTNDKKFIYQFKVEGDTLIFDEKNSSSVKLIDEQLGVQLTDGDTLHLVE